ncbi:MAG: class I SAM-dependent methyltransferase [Bacteroidia bacterium]
MENFDREKHWENIYKTKQLQEVSWFQPTPETALDFIKQFKVSTTAKIIDIGGGDGFLVDHLLRLGYTDLTVLDISATAIEKAKQRLDADAIKVKWIVADVTTFKPIEKYDFWYDRASFHFLTQDEEIANYVATAHENINDNGILVIGTFSEQGPTKCSGIAIKQYSEKSISNQFKQYFEKINCLTVDHPTPSGSLQNFTFCSFNKIKAN